MLASSYRVFDEVTKGFIITVAFSISFHSSLAYFPIPLALSQTDKWSTVTWLCCEVTQTGECKAMSICSRTTTRSKHRKREGERGHWDKAYGVDFCKGEHTCITCQAMSVYSFELGRNTEPLP